MITYLVCYIASGNAVGDVTIGRSRPIESSADLDQLRMDLETNRKIPPGSIVFTNIIRLPI